MLPQQPQKVKYVPHKTLRDVVGFLSVADSDSVIEVHADINKVSRVMDAEGKPGFAPDGMPNYQVGWNVRIVILSKEEWNVRKHLMEEGN